MKKSVVIGALGCVVAVAGYGANVLAYRGDGNVGPNYSPERHEIMTRAFAENDYATWKSQMGDRGVTRRVNEENFAQFARAHQLQVEGKADEANRIREQLGLGTGQRSGKSHRNHNSGENFIDKNNDGICDRLQ